MIIVSRAPECGISTRSVRMRRLVQQQSAATAPYGIDPSRPARASDLRQRPRSAAMPLDGKERIRQPRILVIRARDVISRSLILSGRQPYGPAVASQRIDSAITTGAFALGGVVLGGGLDWVRAFLASKRAEVGQRDELIAALDVACISLMTESRSWRMLDTSSSKLHQLAFGLLEAGLPELPRPGSAPLSATDFGYLLVRWLGMG